MSRAFGVAISQPNPVLPVNQRYTQVDSTANFAICLKGFEDRRMRPSGVSVGFRNVRPVRFVSDL